MYVMEDEEVTKSACKKTDGLLLRASTSETQQNKRPLTSERGLTSTASLEQEFLCDPNDCQPETETGTDHGTSLTTQKKMREGPPHTSMVLSPVNLLSIQKV
jgi:hypothetical protein